MRLLLAEDEKSLSRAVKAILEKNNFSVDAVYDGVEALEYLESGNYDGVIMDVMMPKMDGITALKKLRAAGNMVPVLMLTAKSEIDDKVEGLDSGANDYLTKPFDTKELLARIRAMTRSANANIHADSSMHVGNITLDTASYELSSPSGSYKLANKEYQMMEMMMANPKQLISTERFMEKIWGYDSEAEINVVWVYISYLRKKLEALNADIQIKATRNAGYSLEEKALLHVADRGVGLDLAVNLIGNVRPAEHLLDLRGYAEPDEVFVRYEQHLFKAPLADLVGDHRAAPCAVVRRLVQYDAVHGLSVWRLLPFRTAGSRR